MIDAYMLKRGWLWAEQTAVSCRCGSRVSGLARAAVEVGEYLDSRRYVDI